ncbi:MAG: hypothetical protein AB9856_03715 [Cellulosilyticaceae bacterium]
MMIESIVGFNKLTKAQQALFVNVNTKHLQAVEDKAAWTPVRVEWDKTYLKVWFKNGDWLHYIPNGVWY